MVNGELSEWRECRCEINSFYSLHSPTRIMNRVNYYYAERKVLWMTRFYTVKNRTILSVRPWKCIILLAADSRNRSTKRHWRGNCNYVIFRMCVRKHLGWYIKTGNWQRSSEQISYVMEELLSNWKPFLILLMSILHRSTIIWRQVVCNWDCWSISERHHWNMSEYLVVESGVSKLVKCSLLSGKELL